MIKQMEEQRHNQGSDLIVDFIISTVFIINEVVDFFMKWWTILLVTLGLIPRLESIESKGPLISF